MFWQVSSPADIVSFNQIGIFCKAPYTACFLKLLGALIDSKSHVLHIGM